LLALPISNLSASDPFNEMNEAFGDIDKAFEQSAPPSKKPEMSEFEKFKLQETNAFDSYKKKLMEEFAEFKKISQKETQRYQSKLSKVWDKPELSSRKVWVEYSKDLKEKKSVDFEKQTISISHTHEGKQRNDKELRSSLKKLITKNKAEAFKDDTLAQAIEKKSKEKITLLETAKVKPTPILIPKASAEQALSDKEIDEIVDRMIKLGKKKEQTNKQGKKVVSVEVPMNVIDKKLAEKEKKIASSKTKKPKAMADLRVNKLPRQAKMLSSDVSKFAAKSKIEDALVYAIIETESAFNPMARSPIPAYGLMQIVPSSAGQDATQQLFGKAKILSPSYLYTSDKNIEVGTTYLNILYYRYLKGIKNELSRLYCSIAAYNTGAGNVAKAFTGKRRLKPALAKINALTPQEVYDHLIEHLPYEETRKYLAKVKKRIPKYR
ncbi:transglycosylase SLT domain-containing protein, partial [Oleiphilus sp. HI0123]